MAAWLLAGAPVYLSQAQPTIVLQPADQLNVTVGNTALFRVGATTTTGTLIYQWRLNGVTLAGATKSQLQIANTQPTNCGQYSVAVSDGNLAINSSTAELTVNIASATGNDFFTNRYSLPSTTNGAVRSSNTSATGETGEPNHDGKSPVKSIWFKWTAPTNGIVTFTTTGSGFDTVMSAYGPPANVLTRLVTASGSIDDDDGGGYLTSQVSFNATAGQPYAIAVDGNNGASGNVVLNWSEEVTSDTLASVTTLPTIVQTVANNALGDFVVLSSSLGYQWYFNGAVDSGNGASEIRIVHATLATVGSYMVRITGFNALGAAGTHYSFTQPSQLQINYHDDGSTDTNSVAVDKFLDAVTNNPVTGQGFSSKSGGDSRGYTTTQVFNTTGGSKEPGEPNHCGQIGGASVWYSYKPTTNALVHVTTAGSLFNTILAVYIGPGDSFATLTNVGCGYTTNYAANGQPDVYFTGDTKTTYFIVVDGYNGATGAVQLVIANGAAINATTPPTDQIVWATSNATFNVTASGASPLNFQWQFAGTNIPSATNSSYTVTNATLGKTGAYTVFMSNMVSTASLSANLSLYTAPTIATDLTNQTAIATSNVTFVVAANGTAPFSYQWKLGSTATNLIGATNSTLTLTNIQSTNANSYRCVITNVAGAITSSVATLTVNIPASVATNPTNVTVIAGSTATFHCGGAGTSPFGYQWRFGGVPISGATQTPFSVNNTTSTNAGSYDCVVTNVAGSATSSVAVLTVNVPPTMTNQPVSKTTITTSNVTFTCQASGTAPLSYQWRFAGGVLGGATTTAYTLSNVQTNNAGSYDCVVTNVAGTTTSTTAILTVNVPPSVTNNPVNQSVTVSSNVTFTCQAIGTAPLSYQWRFAGGTLGGATNTAYTISNVQTNNAGSYDCVVTNVAGSATSSVAALIVNVPPNITTNPADVLGLAGIDCTFNCVATGTAPLSYQWRFGGVAISGATTTTLTVSNPQSTNAGNYDCVVTNIAGMATSSVAVLTVTYLPPHITSNPISETVSVGGNTFFICLASGTAPLAFQWRLAGNAIAGATNTLLSITNAQSTNAGNYDCVVTNVAGSTNSGVAVLTVNIPPAITTDTTNLSVTLGNNVTFICAASGTAPLHFQWRWGGIPGDIPGATNSTYSISNVQTTNAGNYRCVVTNIAGTASSSQAILTVNVSPAITLSPVSRTVTAGTTAILTATASGSPAPSYQWKLNGANVGVNSSTLTIPNFQSVNEGSYHVVASNVAGSATSSDAILLLDAPFRLIPLGLTNQTFQFQLIGVIGSNYVFDLSTNSATWTPLQTNLNTTGFLIFNDTNSISSGLHIYRSRIWP